MSQSLYTAMSGIAAATTSLEVISNNIANINTTGYKSSSVNFSDVFYQTVSSGSVATGSTGGTNPVQVGVGTQVSSVSKNFSTGSWMATGSDTDLMIQGSGFFCVQGPDGSVFYTRDGNFSFDSNGNLVTATGYKVSGTDNILASNSSGATVKVPLSIGAVVKGTDTTALSLEAISSVNGFGSKNITSGDFILDVTDTQGNTYSATIKALAGITPETTVGGLVNLLGGTNGLNFTDESGNQVQGIGVSLVDGKIQIDTSNASVDIFGGDTYGIASMKFKTTSALTNPTNFLTVAGLSSASTSYNTNRTSITNGTMDVSVTTATGTYTGEITIAGITGTTTAAEARDILNTALANITVPAPNLGTITGITASMNSNGVYTINAYGAVYTPDGNPPENAIGIEFGEGSSNLFGKLSPPDAVNLTSTATISATSYNTSVFDYTVTISELTSAAESISATTQTINNDGSIQVTYDNGSVLSVQVGPDGATYEFVYTTSDNIQIAGEKCNVDNDVAVESNFVVQVATITNTNGLIAKGSNLFAAGPNSGDIVYTVAGRMGSGTLQSGGLEASNVDMSGELSNMILAQRAIQANARIFSTTSQILETVVNMGR